MPDRYMLVLRDGEATRVEFDDVRVGDVFTCHASDGTPVDDKLYRCTEAPRAIQGQEWNSAIGADPIGTIGCADVDVC